MFGTGELAQARADYAALLPFTVTVKRRVANDNGAGGQTVAASTTESSLLGMCWSKLKRTNPLEGERPRTIQDFEVHLGHATRAPETFDVLARDSIFINGIELRVETIDKGKSEALYLACFCVQVQ